ncbi:MAG TPA: hypothetical protein PKV73_18300, partial [Agriterribacter sp.]|nr:hypothetical protein [Agriterribacter sp.]
FATTSLAGLVYSQDVVLVYSPRPTNLVLTLNFYLWRVVAEKKNFISHLRYQIFFFSWGFSFEKKKPG